MEHLALSDAGHGYDAFGAHPDWVRLGSGLLEFLYDRWFRVQSHDPENIPASGAAILAANHSGTLPFDGAMIWADVLRQTDPPRVARPVADHFVAELPFVSTLFARAGTVGGSRGNVRHLIEQGELLLIFPEGTPGIGKKFSERYRLAPWRVGHVELAIRHGIAVVPVAVIGAEEQMPTIATLPIHAFGSPYLPIVATPIPLPVRYHIYYGTPLQPGRDLPRDGADDPAVLRGAATKVRHAVEALIERGLQERPGVFA
jgi:1-acyl-sn-glycerol-3-phosphate acyltransferase